MTDIESDSDSLTNSSPRTEISSVLKSSCSNSLADIDIVVHARVCQQFFRRLQALQSSDKTKSYPFNSSQCLATIYCSKYFFNDCEYFYNLSYLNLLNPQMLTNSLRVSL